MSKNNRKLFSFAVTKSEKELIDRSAAKNGMTRSAYARFKIFQPDQPLIESTRHPLANNAVPEINVKTYQTLKQISDRLDRLNEIINSDNPTNNNPVNVDATLLEETLNQVNTIGTQLAIASSKI